MSKPSAPLVKNRSAAVYLGILAWGAGSVLLWDAYAHRGIKPPFILKLAGLLT